MKGFTKGANQKVMGGRISRNAPGKTVIAGRDLRTKKAKK